MRCSKCGQYNPDTASFCHTCGGTLVDEPAVQSQYSGSKDRRCVECGRPIAWDSNVCPYCGKDYRIISYPGMGQHVRRKTAKPVIAGVLLIVAGAVELLPLSFIGFDGIADWFFGLWALSIAAAILSFVGGVAAMTRKYFPLALAGGIASLFGFGVLGIIAVVLIAISYEEFER